MAYRNIEKHLVQWQPADGEYIHLPTLRNLLPGHRWDLYLIGTTTGGAKRPQKTKPLLGRLRMEAVVVLVSSLREWLMHYNPGKEETVEAMIRDMQNAQRKYLENLKVMRAMTRMRSGTEPGRKPSTAKVKQAKALKVTSNDVFGAWK